MARHRKKKKPLSPEKQQSIERTCWALDIVYSDKTQRGLTAEKAIFGAFDYHRQQKTIFPGGRIITHIEKTLHFSPDDIEGIDVFVRFQSDEVLPVQARNWWSRKAEKVSRRKGICLIVIWLSYRDKRRTYKSSEEIKNEARENVFTALCRWFSDRDNPISQKKGVDSFSTPFSFWLLRGFANLIFL